MAMLQAIPVSSHSPSTPAHHMRRFMVAYIHAMLLDRLLDFSEPSVPSGSYLVFTLNITAQIGRTAQGVGVPDVNNQDVRQPDGDDTSGQHGTMQVSCLSSDINLLRLNCASPHAGL